MSRSFKDKYSFQDRKNEADRIISKYPYRRPIIVEKHYNNPNIQTIDKKKYLVPIDLNMGQFLYVIRKRIKLSPEKSLYIFLDNNIIPPLNITISNIYDKHKDSDNFLYITYDSERTFG